MRDKNKRGGRRLQRKRGDFWTELSKVTLPASVSPERKFLMKNQKKIKKIKKKSKKTKKIKKKSKKIKKNKK